MNNEKTSREKYLEKYYTKEGVLSLETRLKTLVMLYNEKKEYPLRFRLYGFPELVINHRMYHKGMIEELQQILGL